jgi:hypothetical protein
VAFGIVSFLSLLRARSRRNAIVREVKPSFSISRADADEKARRLGLMVPGIPGYVSMRERANMKWTKADGTQDPDWWEIEGKRDTDSKEKVEVAGQGEEEDFEIVRIQVIGVPVPSDKPETVGDNSKNCCICTRRTTYTYIDTTVFPESSSI